MGVVNYIANSSDSEENPALAANGRIDEYLVVWDYKAWLFGKTIQGRLLYNNWFMLPIFTISPTTGSGDNENPAAACNNSGYFVTYERYYPTLPGDIYGRMMYDSEGDELAVDFGLNGLWYYDGSAWSRMTTWNPGDGGLAGWDGGLAADFDGNGLWNFNGTTWSKKSSWNPGSGGMAGWDGGLAVDFDGNGLWSYNGSTWSKITSWDSGSGGLAGWSGGLAVDFDGNGLWTFNGTTWSKITSWDPGSGGLAGWTGGLALTGFPWNPEGISALGSGLAADFGTNGLWYYDGSTWSRLTIWNAENLTDVDLN